jgi:hypothetical protein
MIGKIDINPRLSPVADGVGPDGQHYALASYSSLYNFNNLGGFNLYNCANFPLECHLVHSHALNMQEAFGLLSEDSTYEPRLVSDESGLKFFLGDELLYSESEE